MYFLLIKFKPYFCAGEMSERFNEAVLKTVDPKGPGVRIPLSPRRTVANRYKNLQIPVTIVAGIFIFRKFPQIH